MKIALYYNLPGGGALSTTFEEVNRLNKNHSIDLFLLSTANRNFRDITKFVNKVSIIEYAPLKKFIFPFSRLNWIIQIIDLLRLENAQKKVAVKINKNNYDLCWLTTCQFTEIPLIMKYIKIPIVYFSHSTTYPEYVYETRPYLKSKYPLIKKLFPDFGQIIYSKILQKKKHENIKCSSLVLTCSYFMTKQLYQKYAISAKVNYAGIDINKFNQSSKVFKENFILSIGALEPWKGHDFLIESLSLIPESKRPSIIIACHLTNENEKKYLTDLAEKLKVKLVLIENANIVEYYNKTKIFCFAAHLEPFGLVALESMACETPVIGIKEGGICETVVHGKNGLLIERNHKKFAEAIQYLLDNEDIAKKYGQHGKKDVIENWTWEKSVSELERYFYDIVSNKK